MTDGKDAVTIRIRRSTIEAGDPSGLTELLGSFVPGELEAKRNRVRFEVEGYGDGEGDLFEIEEVREFFGRLFDENEGLFYWIDPEKDAFMLLGLMLYEPRREADTVGLDPEDLRAYLQRGLEGLDSFCARLGISAGKSEDAVTRFVKGKLGS